MAFMLEILSYVFWVLLAIMILVFVHEMGHFLAAKLFGMRVDRFSIGFPPKLFGKKWGETEYAIGATPLGGYVKIAGMIDESFDTEDMDEEPEPYEYRAKPVWQRIIVITAGVIFNVLLAWGIYTGMKLAYGETYVPAENIEAVYVEEGTIAYQMGLRTGDQIVAVAGAPFRRFEQLRSMETLTADSLTITVVRDGEQQTFVAPENVITKLTRAGREGEGFGVSYLPPLIGGVLEGSPADEIGLQPGDRIVAIGGEPVYFWTELTGRLQAAEGEPVTIRWRRPDSLVAAADEEPTALAQSGSVGPATGEGRVYQARFTPMRDSTRGRWLLGVAPPSGRMLRQEFGVQHTTFGLGEAIAGGLEETWTKTAGIAVSLKRIFTGRDSFRENVGGPVAIAKITKEAAEAGARYFWGIVAFLSITLAIMNILPIPALDGGHLVFLLYEAVTRREPSVRVRLALQQIGMVVLIAFMAFVIFNDILRL